MYVHHARRKRRGWVRNCYYSQAQQIIRMDPLYYLLNVCLRKDHLQWLVSYPYYIKSTTEGESTGFKHLDLHPEYLLQYGESAIQGSASLTDEDDSGCTMIVPGMHRWFSD